jgi:MOSC domain-containing protein YiiM
MIRRINVGGPREVEWRGKRVRTSIFKDPVAGAVRARTLNLDGDGQSDLSVHGGPYKAVYAYPAEHYAYWREQLPVDPPAVTIADVLRLYTSGDDDQPLLRRASEAAALPESWRAHFRARLAGPSS